MLTAELRSGCPVSFVGKLPVEDFLSDPSVEGPSSTPDHPVDPAGTGGPATRGPVSTQSNGTSNETSDDLLPLPPSMFVPLYSDWNSAMATWGAAWEAHVYGLGAVFALVALLSVLNLLCLPVRCPSGCGYFVLVNLFLLAAGASRGFLLFYDAYSHQDKLPGAATLLLYEAPFPCLTAAFGTVFLLISTRSRIQLPRAVIHHPCFLAASVLLHFGAAFGSVAVLHVFPRLPCLFLVSQGTSVVLAAILATVYFVFYCYVQADSKHIYHLDHASPPAKRHGRCPFADARDWERAAVTVAFGALFTLACAGLRLYAMLHALGLVGVEVFHPWPWWAFHLSCQLCEVGLCLALALVIMHPVCSSSKPPGAKYRPRTSRGLSNPTATKPPVLPSNHPWATSQQGELAPGDTVSRSECERLPLYPMASHHLGSVDGLDLLCTSEPALDLPDRNPSLTLRLGTEADSTADLRPPSPINLRRSIDEALFSEALIPRSLFSLPRPRSPSGISLGAWSVSDGRPFRRNLAGRPLCRTSSCTDSDVALPGQPRPLTGSSPSSCHTLEDTSSAVGRWHSSPPAPLRGPTTDTFSAGLCSNQDQGSSPQRKGSISPEHTSQGGVSQPTPFGRGYQALELPPHPEDDNLSVQAEFINVCRQIDALSICSDTIEL
ncbi:proline-rich transmembrane protein 4 [Arapaima gigas]